MEGASSSCRRRSAKARSGAVDAVARCPYGRWCAPQHRPCWLSALDLEGAATSAAITPGTPGRKVPGATSAVRAGSL